jgi:hypothetical protein
MRGKKKINFIYLLSPEVELSATLLPFYKDPVNDL